MLVSKHIIRRRRKRLPRSIRKCVIKKIRLIEGESSESMAIHSRMSTRLDKLYAQLRET